MASSATRLLVLAALLASVAALATAQKAATPAAPTTTPAKAKPAPAAPSPGAAAADGSPPTDVVKVLEKSGKYSTFLRLLKETRVDTQVNSQLMDSYNGLTIFAPTDAAFDALKSGTLNGLSQQDQIQMVLYTVLPRFYSLSMLNTLNGPVNTQASGADGPYKYKIKPSGNNVNISTGVNAMLLSTIVSKDFPLAVYSVDKVPLPYELFGPKPPTPAPAPAPAPSMSKSKSKKPKKSGIAEPPTADDASADDSVKAAATTAAVPRWVAAAGALAAAVLGTLF